MPSPFHLQKTFGAAFIGLVVASILYGVSIVQTWYYYTHQSDSWPLKLLVTVVMTFDTAHQALITHTIYTYTITYWGDPEELQLLVWSILVEIIFTALTALIVQSFLTMRVWLLSNRNKFLTGVMALLVLGEFGAVLAYICISLQMETWAELAKLESLSISINALAACGDVLIAGALCVLLHLSRTGFQRTDTMINKLMLFAVNTGFITSLCAVSSLIAMVIASDSFVYVAFYFCLGRLYTNCLLATLNARKRIRNVGSDSSDGLPMMEFAKPTSSGERRPTNISIKIDTTKEVAGDAKQDNHDLEATETASSSAQDFEGNHIAPVGP